MQVAVEGVGAQLFVDVQLQGAGGEKILPVGQQLLQPPGEVLQIGGPLRVDGLKAGEEPQQLYSIDNPVLTVSALKLSEDSSSYILRLFEPTGSAQDAVLTFPALGMDYKLSMQPFEIKTLKIDPVSKTVTETNLLERA